MDATPDIVDFVLGFLALLSLLIWTIGIAKFISFYRAASRDQAFLETFEHVNDVNQLAAIDENAQGPLARICAAALIEVLSWRDHSTYLSAANKREMLVHAIKLRGHEEQTRMENGLGVLASVGSTAPFIGLFGTVWGIMHALKGISVSGSAGLDVVAGPIGEALIATAIGIATAVPAVLAYNYFLRKVRLAVAAMENFASAFQYLVVKSGMGGE
jgi:biopolymer transport protein ExbB